MNNNNSNNPKEDKPTSKQQFQLIAKKASFLKRYLWLVFLILIVVIYGYVLLKINGFLSATPSPSTISQNLKASATPVINQNVVNELNNLQNNSVSVQALFNQARSNPFQ